MPEMAADVSKISRENGEIGSFPEFCNYLKLFFNFNVCYVELTDLRRKIDEVTCR